MITVSNIANASRGELLCITYELLLEQIDLATKSANLEERKKSIQKAIKIIHMLVGDLDLTIELSHELFRIYVYVQGLLINAKEDDKLQEAYRLIYKIYEGYKKVLEEEESKTPSIANAETVYAGFTYGKQSVNEFTMADQNRGFKA